MIWCLHGALGQSGDWNAFSQAMAERGQACRGVELWRFLECEGIGLVDWAAAFNSEVRAAGEKENYLVGYSMGGRLALHALLDDPDLWTKAVIVSAHPGLCDEQEKLERMASDAEWAGLALTSDWKQFLQRWDTQAVLRGKLAEEPDPRMRLVNRRRAIARSFMEWSLGKQENLRGRLEEVTCPVLWLTGELDRKFTSLAQEVVPALAHGCHESLSSVGHRLPWEADELFVKLVEEFLE
ncbi:MAG: alpha/beta fold hydrolase [Roseibacillus sp.]